MTPTRLTISDGIELSTIQTNKFKSGLITLTVNVPLTKKNIAYNMLLTSVLKRGTESYPSIATLNKRLDELYSSSLDIKSARIGKNLTLVITADMLENKYIPDGTDVLGGVLDLIAEMVSRPHLENGCFPIAIVEQEKQFLIESIDSVVNNTRSYASTRLSEMIYSQDKEFPTIEELKSDVSIIGASDLTDYYKALWQGSTFRFFYVGGIDADTLSTELCSRFSPRRNLGITPSVKPYAEPICEYAAVTEKMPVSQGKLALGFKVGVCMSDKDDSHLTAILLNEIFGGSVASKLFMNVREKMSLCYYCSSAYDRYTGTMTVSSGIESKNREIAENAILSELESIKNGKISKTELDAAKKSLLNGYRQISDSPYDLQSYFSNREFFGFTENIEYAKDKILKLTAKNVSELARNVVCDSVFFVEGDLNREADDTNDE